VSLSLERLRALQRQAGRTDAVAAPLQAADAGARPVPAQALAAAVAPLPAGSVGDAPAGAAAPAPAQPVAPAGVGSPHAPRPSDGRTARAVAVGGPHAATLAADAAVAPADRQVNGAVAGAGPAGRDVTSPASRQRIASLPVRRIASASGDDGASARSQGAQRPQPGAARSVLDWVDAERTPAQGVARPARTATAAVLADAAPPARPAIPRPRSVLDWIDGETAPLPDVTAASAAPSERVPAVLASARASVAPTAPEPPLPALRRRSQDIAALRRLIGQRERQPSPARAPAAAPARSGQHDRGLPGREIAPGLQLVEAFLPQPIPPGTLSLAFAKRADAAVDPRDLLFFDTETTGLAGGTGTRAFMIGAADWHVDGEGREGLRVRQLLIATMAAETAMLREFAGWLSPRSVLSSYNGRCYDAPLLKTRYRLARLPEPLGALDHVDLLFPTRRRYRGTWENCRLATIERQLLRIVREDDLPGSEAPAAWLTYLRGGGARNLRRVGEHNHQDVVTLAQLFQRLVQVEQDEREAAALDAAG
jgi:uncharacterized protein